MPQMKVMLWQTRWISLQQGVESIDKSGMLRVSIPGCWVRKHIVMKWLTLEVKDLFKNSPLELLIINPYY